jgi:hypothetical protein
MGLVFVGTIKEVWIQIDDDVTLSRFFFSFKKLQ